MTYIRIETIRSLTGVTVHSVGVEKGWKRPRTEQKPLGPKGRHLRGREGMDPVTDFTYFTI